MSNPKALHALGESSVQADHTFARSVAAENDPNKTEHERWETSEDYLDELEKSARIMEASDALAAWGVPKSAIKRMAG